VGEDEIEVFDRVIVGWKRMIVLVRVRWVDKATGMDNVMLVEAYQHPRMTP